MKDEDASLSDLPSHGSMDWSTVDETKGLTGRAFFVEGGVCWDIEEGLDKTRHLWLGEKPNSQIVQVQQLMRKIGYRERN